MNLGLPITGTTAGWQIPTGDGQVIVLASASLLSNHQIANADNARFAANLIAHHLGPTGAFVFDDLHLGFRIAMMAQAISALRFSFFGGRQVQVYVLHVTIPTRPGRCLIYFHNKYSYDHMADLFLILSRLRLLHAGA